MKKKKENQIVAYFDSKGNIKAKGQLRHGGININITAGVKDWHSLFAHYVVREEELFKDLFPIIQAGRHKAYWRNKNALYEGHKYFLNVIRVLSFVIYTHYSNEFKKHPELSQKESKRIKLTREIILQSHVGAWAKHHKIIHFTSAGYKLESFYNDYIQKGKRIIDKGKYLKEIVSILSPKIQEQSAHDKKIIGIIETSPFLKK